MYYTYILKSKFNGEIYIGSTNNLKRRFIEHNKGKEISTKRYMPWSLLYYEAYSEEKLARMREKRLKHNGNAIRELKKRIEGSPSTTFQEMSADDVKKIDLSIRSGLLKTVKSGAGFTFIEIIIVFTIMAIVSTIGLASFVNYSRTQTLNNAVWDLTTMLNKAKSNTQSQVIGDLCGSSRFSGYKVKICKLTGSTCVSTTVDYELDAVCEGINDDDNSNNPIDTKKLPDDISFDQTGTTSTSFLFKALLGGVDGAGNVGITATYGTTKTVGVDSAGNIKVE